MELDFEPLFDDALASATAKLCTDAEITYLAAHGIAGADPVTMVLIRQLVGDVNREPIMWVLENPVKREVGHTHYKAVAEAYKRKPGYTVTPIYPRAGL